MQWTSRFYLLPGDLASETHDCSGLAIAPPLKQIAFSMESMPNDPAPVRFVPFLSADGTMNFSPKADPKEMREWGFHWTSRGIVAAGTLVRAIDFIRDGNTIKNHMAKAERFQLARETCARAEVEAQTVDCAELSGVIVVLAAQLATQVPRVMMDCLSTFHAERLARIAATKSGLRQLKVARTALKELERLQGRDLPSPVAERFAEITQHWRDQEALCADCEST